MLTPNQIRARLLDADLSVNEVALRIGVSPSTVSGIIGKHRVSRRVRDEIARLIGMTYKDVWENHHSKAA